MAHRPLHTPRPRAARERDGARSARGFSSLKKPAHFWRQRPPDAGFTLFELLLYVGIFAVSAGLLTGVLTTLTRVQVRENASVEVSTQAQFVIQRVQQLIRDASLVELPANTATSTLKLRTSNATIDPTCVQLSGGVVYVMQGNDGVNKQNCLATSSPQAAPLTDARVIVNSLTFTKFSNPPAKDTTQINLTISYNSTNPQESVISRTLETAITKVSAAVFDSDIVPAADNAYDAGLSAQRWRNGLFSNNLLVGYTSMTGGVAAFNGNVGIGTTNPTATAGRRLEIDGTNGGLDAGIALTSGAAGGKRYEILSTGGSGAGLYFRDDASSTYRMAISSSGNVGIGTMNPKRHLVVSDVSSPLIGLETTSNGLGWFMYADDVSPSVFHIGNYTNSGWTNASYPFNINSSGNVGIGMTTPGSPLDVTGMIRATDKAFVAPASGKGVEIFDASDIGHVSAFNRGAGVWQSLTLEGSNVSLNVNGGNAIVSNLISCGGIQTNASGMMSCTSDARLKDIKGDFTAGLAAINRINPQTYSWKQDSGLYDGGVLHSGFVAQNVETAIPEAVTTNPKGYKQVDTTSLLAAAVNAIKELGATLSGSMAMDGTTTGISKNFAIPDPFKPGYTLVHSTLEGPEIAVFYRGEGHLVGGKATVTLPDYFEALTRKEGRTVLLTPEFTSDNESISMLAASSVHDGSFSVRATDDRNAAQEFFWEVKAVRADQPRLEVEVPSR